ncbi:chloride channel protein [Kaistella antarctica]|uniref:Chloride channel protein n=1 Tax=Kaistella antarctica TaxID=266748 RepID=A0A448NQQ7_9FLAO|nr:chloride channel protein [Kaistella antarctica]KEY19014.1 chloride channel protein [Kaistella antarctica]SEW12671.1 chloride channel protein, CIC family [Kaistella antarctica]VEH99070.1 H(+)/Cl(-) exchange transporter ClcA [Kaistella antarctica]
MERKKIVTQHYFRLVVASMMVGLASALLAFTLKHLTEFFEHYFFNFVQNKYAALFIILPSIGITAIYFLRKYLFQNRKNKGITEIYKTLDQRKDHLPLFKIPSHFFNGFLTVIFGGSTGVEVSTVVATATIGNYAYEKEFSARMYKRELICAGVVAGVAILFTSPLAGFLFAMEVIARKTRKSLIIACTASALISWLFIELFDSERILSTKVEDWNYNAIPFFVVLSILGGILSVYFTLLVTRMKKLFSNISNNFIRVNLGAIAVGTLIFFFPTLYGDSYHGLREVLTNPLESASAIPVLFLLAVAVLKPLASSLTLGAGGDGGVFAPSIVAGAFLGLMVAFIGNTYFGMKLIPVNFALLGAAVTLSASLYAPFTSVILICNLLPDGYNLFVPILVCCFIATQFAKILLPYNVYTYDFYLSSKASS